MPTPAINIYLANRQQVEYGKEQEVYAINQAALEVEKLLYRRNTRPILQGSQCALVGPVTVDVERQDQNW